MSHNVTVNTPCISAQFSFRSNPHGRDWRMVTTIITLTWFLYAFLVKKFTNETTPYRAGFLFDDLFFQVIILWVLICLRSRVADISLNETSINVKNVNRTKFKVEKILIVKYHVSKPDLEKLNTKNTIQVIIKSKVLFNSMI